MLTGEGRLGLGRGHVAEPGLEGGATQITGQRLRDLRLTFLAHLLDGPQLLGPPLQRAGAPTVEHTAHLGEDTGCTTVGGLVTRDLDCRENSSKLLDPIP